MNDSRIKSSDVKSSLSSTEGTKKHNHNIIGPVTVNFAALLIKKYVNANPNTTSL